jgi:DNA-binding NtrC family response regulator
MRRFHQYPWPGNVRELRNALESMMVLAEGDVLTEKDLPERLCEGQSTAVSSGDLPAGLTMEELERMAITRVLDECQGNRTHASDRLGISVRTLQRKLRQYEQEGHLKKNKEDILAEV